MFEYLMPLLVMRDYEGTLLDETYRAVVARQIEYGAERQRPVGHLGGGLQRARPPPQLPVRPVRRARPGSEARPFGRPRRRALRDDARRVRRAAAPRFENLRRLEREGALARYGFYESIDYTPERLPENQQRVTVRAFMAHHQGMSLVALDNLINGDVMQRRFHAEPLVQATELLLQERVPRSAPAAHPRAEEVRVGPCRRRYRRASRRASTTRPTSRRRARSCSPNGTYSVMLTTAGSGYLRPRPARRDALARGRDAGQLRLLHLPARRAQRRGLVGRAPARGAQAAGVRGDASPRIRSTSGAATRAS